MRTQPEAAPVEPDLADPSTLDGAILDDEGAFSRWFTGVRNSAHALLPGPVGRWVPVTAVGFALLNGFTFSVDLVLLTALHQVPQIPYEIATTLAYITALSLAYVLNRHLNFKSEKKAWPETIRYTLTVVANYVIFIVGLNSFLYETGLLPHPWPRLIAGLGEAVFMYLMMRFFVFRRPVPPGQGH